MSTYLVHPWTSHRLSVGLTQKQVAEELGVSRHYVIRLEQGLFAHPPPGTCTKLGALYMVVRERMEKEYYEYQKNTRVVFGNKHQNFDELYAYQESEHPLVFWRETNGLSRIGLCKGLCLHQQTLRNYELNHHSQRHPPADLIEAAHELDWDLEPLIAAVASWRIKWR